MQPDTFTIKSQEAIQAAQRLAHERTNPEITVDLQVAQLVDRVRGRGVEVELADQARELIANLGWDPTYGARPLKRVIQKRLVDKLAPGRPAAKEPVAA